MTHTIISEYQYLMIQVKSQKDLHITYICHITHVAERGHCHRKCFSRCNIDWFLCAQHN